MFLFSEPEHHEMSPILLTLFFLSFLAGRRLQHGNPQALHQVSDPARCSWGKWRKMILLKVLNYPLLVSRVRSRLGLGWVKPKGNEMTLFCPSNFDVIRSSLTLIASIAYILVRVHSTEKCPSQDQIAHLLSVAAKYRVTITLIPTFCWHQFWISCLGSK